MKKILMFSAFSCLVLLLVSCGDAPKPDKPAKVQVAAEPTPPAKAKPSCQLNMGWDPWEPYQYLTPENTVKGLEIELVTAMADEVGCSLNFIQQNWVDLLNGVKEGGIDILGGASKTAARESFALFSDNYRHESFVLYVRKGEVDKYPGSTIQQILASDFKLGVTENYIYGDLVSAMQDDKQYRSKFVNVPTSEVNYYNLMQNQIDGFLEDPFVAAYTIKRKGLQDQIEAHPIQIHSGDVALMFSKNSVKPETVDAFNQALAKLKSSGKYQKILAKYSF